MFQKLLKNTSHIYEKLRTSSKTIIVYPDGISSASIGSVRLSNIPGNLQRNFTSTLSMLFSLSRVVDASSYFSSPAQTNNYRFDGNAIELYAGDCGTIQEHAVSYPYEPASQLWKSPEGQAQQYSAQLFRGAGQLVNSSIEDCLRTLIQNQVDAIQNPLDAVNNTSKEALDTLDFYIPLFSLLSIGGSIGVVVLALKCSRCLLDNYLAQYSNQHRVVLVQDDDIEMQSERISNNNEQHTTVGTDESSSARVEDLATQALEESEMGYHISQNLIYHANAEKIPEQQLSVADRLDKIGVPEPEEFICPVTNRAMTYPCITDDGHNYEQSVLEKLKNDKQNCPLVPSLKVTTIILNHDLRSRILSFVEQHENIYKESQKLTTSAFM